MARFTKAEVLRRYQAGERDFRGADLRCLRFRGATLAGADFSGADLRGTDFLEADLRGATFVGARCGLPLVRWLGQGVMAMGIGVIAGFILFFGIVLSVSVLFQGAGSFRAYSGLPMSIGLLLLLLAEIIYFAWEGFNSKGINFIVTITIAAFYVAVAVAFAFAFSPYYVFWRVGATAFAGALATFAAVSGASTFAFSLAVFYAGAGTLLVAGAAAGVLAAAASNSSFFTGSFAVALPVAVASSISILLITWWRARQGAPGYAGCRSFGIALGSIGATRFSGADLRGAFFTDALLARSSFAASRRQTTRLERVCWHGAKGLELARPGATLLAEPRCRQLLLSGSAPGADLQGLNLRGAYVPQADLRGADLRESNLSEAVLTEAHLENANLKASQCLGADLEGAHLTGATLEAWNIDHSTKLHAIDCAYVYLLEPFDALGQRRDDHLRERLPHDPNKRFGPGDFEAYFKQVVEEVKLLIKNGVDAKAFQQAFQEVMRQHPQITPESLTGLKRIGEDVLATLQPSSSVDKGAVEQTFFAEYLPLQLENARLHALLEGERRVGEAERQRAEDHRNHAAQLVELTGRLVPPKTPAPSPTSVTIAPVISPVMGSNNAHSPSPAVHTTTILSGDGSLINTGTFNTGGGLVNLGDLSDQARLTIEALPDQRTAEGQPSLRELLQELKASVDADSHLSETTRAEALGEIQELATAAKAPRANGAPARRAMNALKGLSAGISETNKAVEESSKLVGAVKRLLPLIAGFFLG